MEKQKSKFYVKSEIDNSVKKYLNLYEYSHHPILTPPLLAGGFGLGTNCMLTIKKITDAGENNVPNFTSIYL